MRGNYQGINRAVAKDGDPEIKDVLVWIRSAVAEELNKSYPRPWILVIAIEPGRPLNLGEWLSVVKRLFARGCSCNLTTFLVDTDVGEVHKAC